MAQFEDVGLRARIDGVSGYTRDAQKIQAETKRIEQSMTETARGVNQQAAGLIRSLAPIGTAIASAFAVKAGVDMFKGAIMAASDFNETVNKSQVVFGDASKTIEEFAKNASQSLGMSRNEAIGTAATFGNLFTTMGVGKGEAAGMSVEMIKLASDLASFHNIKPEEALEKLKAGLVGEAEPARSLGILLDEETTKTYAYAKGIAKSGAELTQQQKVLARYQIIMAQAGNASGDFQRTSTGVANSMRILEASIADARVELGNRLLPVFQPIISAIATGIPNAVKAVVPLLDGLGAAVANAVKGLGTAFNIGKSIASAIQAGDVQTAFNLIRESFTTWVSPALQGMLQALGQVPGAVVSFIQQWGPGIAAGFADWATRAGKWALDAIPGVLSGLGSLAGSVLGWIGQQTGKFVSSLGGWAKAFGDWTSDAVPSALSKLSELKDNITGWIGQQAPAFAEKLGDWAGAFGAWAGDAIPKALEQLGKLKDDLVSWITTNAPTWGQNLSTWRDQFVKWAAGLWDSMKPGMDSILTKAKTWAEANAPTWKAAFASWVQAGVTTGQEFGGKVIDGIIAKQPEINATARDAGRQTTMAFLEGMAGLLDGYTRLHIDASKAAGRQGGQAGVMETIAVWDANARKIQAIITAPYQALNAIVEGIFQGLWGTFVKNAKPPLDELYMTLQRIASLWERISGMRPPALPSEFIGPVLPSPTPPKPGEPGFTGPMLAPPERTAGGAGMTGPPDYASDRQFGPTPPPSFQIDMTKLTPSTGFIGETIEEAIAAEGRLKTATEAVTTAANTGGVAMGGAGKKAEDAAKKAQEAIKDALKDAEFAVDDYIKALEDGLRELSSAIKIVDAQIKGMGKIRFTGMDEAEDEIFALELAAKKAQLSVLREESGQDTAKKIKEGAKELGESFDMLSAQQREVREGIPVALQKWQWEQEQAKKAAERAIAKAAEPKKEKTGPKEKTAAEKELEAIQKALQIKRLETEITFEPMTRDWEKAFKKATGAEQPTFGSPEEAMAVLQPLLDKWVQLTDEERAQAEQLTIAKGLKEDINVLQREEKISLEDVEAIQGRVNELVNGRVEAEQAVTEELKAQLDIMRTAEKIAEKAWGNPAGAEEVTGAPPAGPIGDEFPGMATGGRALTGGGATVGERGAERVILPAGAAVLPASTGAASVSRSFSDTWNITGGGNPQDIANQLQRMLLMRRMQAGRDDW